MSSPTPIPPKATATQILLVLLGDSGDITLFVQAFLAMLEAEKVATTYLAHVKAAEPVAEIGAALADKLKGQL